MLIFLCKLSLKGLQTVKNDLLKIRKNLLTPTSAKMLLFQDVFLLILVYPTTNLWSTFYLLGGSF